MVVLAVVWMAKPGKESEAAKIFAAMQAESRKEPGCLMYVVHRHRKDPRRFFIYEQYQDDAALQAHRDSPHFQHYVNGQLAGVGDRVEGELYAPLE